MRLIQLFTLAQLISASSLGAEQWGVFQTSFISAKEYVNAFVDVQVDVGIDLMSQLTGQATPPQRALHWLFGSDWAVRRGAWKLVQEGAKELSLVNVEQDLAETTNLAQVNPALVDELTRLHQQWIVSVGNK